MTVSLTPPQRTELLGIAASVIERSLVTGASGGGFIGAPPAGPLSARAATFVTLERRGDLLGCIGSLEPTRPLAEDVAHNAVAAAFRDPRLPPVTDADFPEMSIEVSVLGDLAPLDVASRDELAAALRPGIDGVVIEAGRHRATFLPAVWRHFGDDTGAFLDALWRKAGLGPAWPGGVRCATYTVEKLVDPGPRPPVRRD